MSPESQRIAIAEVCPNIFRILKESGDIVWKRGDWEQDCDPLNDLNAMHEAEKTLENKDNLGVSFYFEMLHKVVGSLSDNPQWRMIHATAPQRAEAFLRTLSLWKP